MNYDQNNGNNYPNNYPNNVGYNYNYANPNNGYYGANPMPLSYHIKRFLIGLLLAFLLIFLLVWLFPTKAGLKATINDSISDAFDKTFAEKLNPLYDRIFQDNIDTMKEVATAYFTTERLPKAEGQTKKLTLGKMLDMKLLLAIKDKNGNMCDTEKSYVEITKMDKEYKMKVNLSCGDEEDYIITYLGCYNYCLNDVCEKKTVTKARTRVIEKTKPTPIRTIIPTPQPKKHYCEYYSGKYYGKYGKVVSRTIYQKQCNNKPQPSKHYCVLYNGKYYGSKGTVVSKTIFQRQCSSTPEKHYCVLYNGKYYGKNGNVVSKATYKKECKNEPTKHYCEIYNGKYYGKNGKVVSKAVYEEECVSKPEKHYCEIYDGKYYGKNGKVVSEETYKRECTNPEDIYKYLYEKIVVIYHEREYSNWSDWSSYIEYNPDNNNINWGKHEFDWYEKVGYKLTKYYSYEVDKSQPIYDTYFDRLLGYKKQYACGGYTYYIDTTTNTTYQSSGTPATGWTKSTRVTLSYLPSQTSTKRYVYIGMDYDHCADTCNLKPYYIFDVYTRSAGTVASSKVSSSKSTVSAVCNNVVEKEIPMYGKRTVFAGYVTNRVLKEKRTYYYHKKTRTLIREAYTDKKEYHVWSLDKHDESLLNQGYNYTGIYKKINY